MTPRAPRLILGSSSPRRLQLLAQIGIVPDVIKGADIDETPLKNEKPDDYCLRVATEKNVALQSEFADDFILTADTTVVVGKRIFGKSDTADEAEKMLRVLSGRKHDVLTAVVIKAPQSAKIVSRLCVCRVTVKRLSDVELKTFLASNEWQGTAGSYKFGESFGQYIPEIKGSPSTIIGLPLFETAQLLKGLGHGTAA